MENSTDRLAEHYLSTMRGILAGQKLQAERAMDQLEPEQFHASPDAESNSISVIVKHLAGNMRSRWTDFLTSDGEKADRHRDDEFIDDLGSREEILERWEESWAVLFDTLEGLGPDDLLAPVTIRGEEHTVVEALQRQASHYAAHVGQIVYLAKHLKGDAWRTLSIPRGGSEDYRPERDAPTNR